MRMRKGRNTVLLLLSLLFSMAAVAQRHEILNKNIRSLQVVANKDWLALPIMELGNGMLDIDFDDLTHEYHRYSYKLEHCEADWRPTTSLFESDYVEGFANGNTIDDVQQSLLTNTIYTHYHLSIPNEVCRPKISGNYLLTIYDDDGNDAIKVCFMVKEPFTQSMGIGLNVVTNTDATINTAHQQVEMELKYNSYNVTNPQTQIKTVLLQNKRWDNARWNAKPQYVMSDGFALEPQCQLHILGRQRIQEVRDFVYRCSLNRHRTHTLGRRRLPRLSLYRIAKAKLSVRRRCERSVLDTQFEQLSHKYGKRLYAGSLPVKLSATCQRRCLREWRLDLRQISTAI